MVYRRTTNSFNIKVEKYYKVILPTFFGCNQVVQISGIYSISCICVEFPYSY
jgi:hypothetical protein